MVGADVLLRHIFSSFAFRCGNSMIGGIYAIPPSKDLSYLRKNVEHKYIVASEI